MSCARTITVNIEASDAGLYHATSLEMKELFITRESVAELLGAVPHMIQAVYDHRGEDVTVVSEDEFDIQDISLSNVIPRDVSYRIRAS